MVRHKLSEGQKWQVIGMSNTGRSTRQIANHFQVNQSIIARLLQKYRATGTVSERHRAGKPHKTTPREDRLLSRAAKRDPFKCARLLRENWHTQNRVSIRTVTRRLNNAGLNARRPIKRPLLTQRHRQARLEWARARQNWNIRSWRRIHWSDESRFLLRHVDGRLRVWRSKGTAFSERNVKPTTAFGGGSVTVWACFSNDCKLPMHILNGTLTGLKYRDDILRDIVVPHFDAHNLASRPLYMDDNARPHRARVVREYLESEAVDVIPWPAMSPDLNPLEHVWDQIGRQIDEKEPPCQNLQELRQEIQLRWRNFPQNKLRRLVHSMRRRVQEVCQKRGGYTTY